MSVQTLQKKASLNLQGGLKIYEFDTINEIMREAEIEVVTTDVTKKNRVILKPSHNYIPALNELNAWRKTGYKFDKLIKIKEGDHFTDMSLPITMRPLMLINEINEEKNTIVVSEKDRPGIKSTLKLGKTRVLFNKKRYKKC